MPRKELMKAAAYLSRLGRMPLNEALGYTREEAEEWLDALAEAEKDLNGV